MKYTKEEKKHARETLERLLKPGTIVYTVLRHVSRSGLQRSIQLKVVEEGGIVDISWSAAVVLDVSTDAKHGGIKVRGCGEDIGYALVHALGMVLWPQGTPKPHGTRNGGPDSFGGYALKHRWIEE